MVLFKHIVGVGNVEMTPEEEAALRAEWQASDLASAEVAQEPTPLEKLTTFLQANPDVRDLIEGE